MTEQGSRETWEALAPEWPPGTAYPLESGHRFWGGQPHVMPGGAWSAFAEDTGITRRDYAELIAPRLVREAANRAMHDVPGRYPAVIITILQHAVEMSVSGRDRMVEGRGPTLCDAALAVIRALEGSQ